MRRFILPVAAILLTAACHSGSATPTVGSSDRTGKAAASPAASPSASAPKTADGPMVNWCHEHPLSDLCTSAGSPKPVLSMPPSPVFSSAMAQVWKQLCGEKNPASVCEATPSR